VLYLHVSGKADMLSKKADSGDSLGFQKEEKTM